MHACHSVSAACKTAEMRRLCGEIGEFLGEFSWVEFDPMSVRGLCFEFISISFFLSY